MPRDIKKDFYIAQEYILHGSHYYIVQAETMGEAVRMIEEDFDVLPVDSDQYQFKVLAYTDSEDNYDS